MWYHLVDIRLFDVLWQRGVRMASLTRMGEGQKGILAINSERVIFKGLWKYHPFKGKIKEIQPMHFWLGDTAPGWTLALSVALPVELSNPHIACGQGWKFSLLPKLLC